MIVDIRKHMEQLQHQYDIDSQNKSKDKLLDHRFFFQRHSTTPYGYT